MVTNEDRRRFLAERRAVSMRRYDELHAPTYDQHWGAISATHRRFVDTLLSGVPEQGLVLDMACGTGKYWAGVLAAGRRVAGIDQSSGMIAQARRKHPGIPTWVLGLQDVDGFEELSGVADGVLLVDALENVGPEDWPGVLAGVVWVLRPEALAYLTVELAEGLLPAPSDPRQVDGEDYDGVGYHYYPRAEQVLAWVNAAGLELVDQVEGDGYWHLLVRRSDTPPPDQAR